ncbi:MAG: hypothetical protein ACI87E_001511 [Mariniblastus sp.]|jgi:hypothetical protein
MSIPDDFIWPNATRSLRGAECQKYDHGTWHYVNIIADLDQGDENAIGPIEAY